MLLKWQKWVEIWPVTLAHRPETDEVLQRRQRYEDAVDECIGEEQDEELVVGETHAVVHPGDQSITNH